MKAQLPILKSVLLYLKLTADMKGKRVGVVKEGFEKCEEDVINIVKAAASSLTKAGAIVEEVSIPLHSDGNV